MRQEIKEKRKRKGRGREEIIKGGKGRIKYLPVRTSEASHRCSSTPAAKEEGFIRGRRKRGVGGGSKVCAANEGKTEKVKI